MIIMGIETSCDETGVGIIDYNPERGMDCVRVVAEEIASSVEQHARFGGVVPEIAARAHVEALGPTVQRALGSAGVVRPDAIAVTVGPGLVGALMVGVAAAKAYALAWGVPLYAVNHVVGHVAVDAVEHGRIPESIALLVSGGHTNLLHVSAGLDRVRDVGGTIDDAAGEAFDKVARIMGLPYPGGPGIDALAQGGDPAAIAFPRSLADDPYRFSFSGLKTAVARYIETTPGYYAPDVAASFQEAVADSVTRKALGACRAAGVDTVILGGGSTANSRIRELMVQRCDAVGITVRIPMLRRCTDNGVMIAAVGAHYISAGASPTSLSVGCMPNLSPEVIGVGS